MSDPSKSARKMVSVVMPANSNPPGGTGSVTQNGATNFESGSGTVKGAKFGGVFTVSGTSVIASGGWSYIGTGAHGNGTWKATQS